LSTFAEIMRTVHENISPNGSMINVSIIGVEEIGTILSVTFCPVTSWCLKTWMVVFI